MTRNKQDLFAVITGDIVNFKKYSPKQRLLMSDVLLRNYIQTQNQFADCLFAKIEIFRGDSWQFIVKNPRSSFRIALYYRALFKSLMESSIADTRISIGIGMVDYLPTKKIFTGDGDAFRQSGMGLDTMPRNMRMQVSIPQKIKSPEIDQINVIMQLVDTIARQWTHRQAYIVCGAMLGWTQEKIALKWAKGEISQQAVAQHLDRAGWNAISASIKYYEDDWFERVEDQFSNNKL